MLTDQQHPITPPPELVREWHYEHGAIVDGSMYVDEYIATQAARWSANRELDKCLQVLDINGCPSKWIDMLRAVLADEPAVPQSREPAAVTGQPRPTEDDVEDAAQCIYEAMRFERVETTPAWSELGNSLAQDTARKAARAVLAHWGNPAPAPPADGEVAELVAWLRSTGEGQPCLSDEGYARLTRAAELLQRQALVPVSVSERLPGPEVCVPHPRTKRGNWCWGFERCEVSLARPARWRLMHMETVEMEASHWLPAHALPLPEVDE